MNKRGQSLIIFVLILPIVVFFIIFFIDVSLMYQEKTHVKGVTLDNMRISLEKNIRDEEKIKNIIKKNDSNIQLDIKIIDNDLKISVESKKKSLFNKVFDFDVYKIKFNYCANYLDKEIKEC